MKFILVMSRDAKGGLGREEGDGWSREGESHYRVPHFNNIFKIQFSSKHVLLGSKLPCSILVNSLITRPSSTAGIDKDTAWISLETVPRHSGRTNFCICHCWFSQIINSM